MSAMTRIEWIRKNNGKFEALPLELPELPEFLKLDPNTFGIQDTTYCLTVEDIERLKQDDGAAFGHSEGEQVGGGIFWVSNKPRKTRKKNTAKKTRSYPDSLKLDNCGKPCRLGQNGQMEADPRRIAALREYYESQKFIDASGNEAWEGESPFACDMAEVLINEIRSNVELCNSFAEYKSTEAA